MKLPLDTKKFIKIINIFSNILIAMGFFKFWVDYTLKLGYIKYAIKVVGLRITVFEFFISITYNLLLCIGIALILKTLAKMLDNK